MKWVLILISSASVHGYANGDATYVTPVQFHTEQLCKSALQELTKKTLATDGYSYLPISGYCLKTSD
jgi:hypothetical protein